MVAAMTVDEACCRVQGEGGRDDVHCLGVHPSQDVQMVQLVDRVVLEVLFPHSWIVSQSWGAVFGRRRTGLLAVCRLR